MNKLEAATENIYKETKTPVFECHENTFIKNNTATSTVIPSSAGEGFIMTLPEINCGHKRFLKRLKAYWASTFHGQLV